MIPPSEADPTRGPLIETDYEVAYTLDVVARVCGVSSETVLHYHEQGLLGNIAEYDDETVRRLRRIEHLRANYGMQSAALKLTLDLMDELDHLRSELRSRS